MKGLAEKECTVCRVGAPAVEGTELEEFKARVPDWDVVEVDGVRRLKRAFKFKDFREALAFTDAVGSVAEDQGHHPSITTEWGRVTVCWWTHKIRGLHENDFIMAARTDRLYTPGG